MKAAFAFVVALCASLTLSSPTPLTPEDTTLEKRGCYVPAPNLNVVDRIYKVARSRNVNSKVMLAMFETAAVESNFNNLDCGDQDSVGVFQQRTSQGWGPVSSIMSIEYSTNKFLDLCIQIDKEKPYLSTGQLAQAVQRSEFPDRYNQLESTARKYLNLAVERNGSGGGSNNGGASNVGTNPNNGNSGSGSSGSSSSCPKTYVVKAGDTCNKIVSQFNISLDKLYGLNKNINGGCTNLQIGVKYCVATGSTSNVSKPSAVPSNIANGTTKSCKTYYTVKAGDVCSKLASNGGITLSSLYTLNTGIHSGSCDNLQIGKAYCIAV